MLCALAGRVSAPLGAARTLQVCQTPFLTSDSETRLAPGTSDPGSQTCGMRAGVENQKCVCVFPDTRGGFGNSPDSIKVHDMVSENGLKIDLTQIT